VHAIRRELDESSHVDDDDEYSDINEINRIILHATHNCLNFRYWHDLSVVK
jgi:hypothetical protein